MSSHVDRPVAVEDPVCSTPAAEVPVVAEMPAAQVLAAGESLEWSADGAIEQTVRRIGGMIVKVTRKIDDDMVAPMVSVSRGAEAVTMVGETVSSGYTHRISSVRNKAGAQPIVML